MNGETPDQPELQAQNGTANQPPSKETPESAAIDEASRNAIAIHLNETAPGPKKRGPKPRQYPPAGSATLPGNMASLDKKTGPQGQSETVQAPPAPFDEKAAQTLVEGGIEVLNEIAKTVIGIVAKKHNCTPEETQEAIKGVQISDKAKDLIKLGGTLCLKKYSVNTGSSPEMLLGGGFLIWGTGIFMTYRALTETDPEPKPAEAKK